MFDKQAGFIRFIGKHSALNAQCKTIGYVCLKQYLEISIA